MIINNSSSQGRVRTKLVKKAARVIIEKYYPRLTLDFQTNKRLADEIAIIPSKRLRNMIAGFVTHLMKRIQKGPVRGISFKLQVHTYIPSPSKSNSGTTKPKKPIASGLVYPPFGPCVYA